jgi:hypothetical protein
MLGHLRTRECVEASSNAYEISAANEPTKIFPSDTKALHIPWPEDRLLASQFEDSSVRQTLRLFRYVYRLSEV